MCKFFSLVSDGKGNINYFDSSIRKGIIDGEFNYEPDSHSSIIEHFFGKQSQTAYFVKGDKEHRFNKYEYNPITKEFEIDELNVEDDSAVVKEKVMELDFKSIVPELQIKEIINPKNIIHGDTATDSEIALLKTWASVRASVMDSVMASVRDSVWASVWDSVRDSVWDSVRDSVWASVRASVRDSVRAYVSSFFIIENWKYVEHEQGKNPFQPCIDLWNLGLVPSYDGKIWRIHKMCDKGKVIYEWKKKEG